MYVCERLSRASRVVVIAVGLGIPLLSPLETIFAQKEPDPPGGGETEKPDTKTLSIDEAYVQEHLENYLRPDKIAFKDGKVELHFDLSKKAQDHTRIFLPNVQTKLTTNFRWTVPREQYSYSWNGHTGLKFGKAGRAFLDCWFVGDVEAEADYMPRSSFNPRFYWALVYSDEKRRNALGANMGMQCVYLSGTRVRKASGQLETIASATRTKVRLKVRPGTFEAFRDNRRRASMEFDSDDFESGQIGFVWGGGVTASVNSLTITGKLDYKKMAEYLRKKNKRR